MHSNLTPGEEWTEHYRGFTLHVNQDRDCWWQVYNGTDRLYVDEFPDSILDELLNIKPIGGRIRVTERGDVLTRIDEGHDAETAHEYDSLWLGSVELEGELVPTDNPEMSIPLDPDGIADGDLWPSVYDGARYSFTLQDNVWWHNPDTKKRHPVTTDIPDHIWAVLRRQKPEGGSFRVTPMGNVVTLIPSPPTEKIRDQFGELPAVVRNIIKLRKERANLEMLPIYVGDLSEDPLEVTEPPSLTDQLSGEEADALEDWAANLGSTSSTSPENHSADDLDSANSPNRGDTNGSETEEGGSSEPRTEETKEQDPPEFNDDPEEWLDLDLDSTEDRINDR